MKILLITDHPYLTTGYGIIGDHLAKHLISKGHTVEFIAWQTGATELEVDKTFPFAIHRTDAMTDRYGLNILPVVVERFKPDIVWTTGDIWMCYHVPLFESAESYQSIWYAPIDSEGMLDEIKGGANTQPIAVKLALRKFDCIIGQTKFASNVVNEQLGTQKSTRAIYPGYDKDNIFPLSKERKLAAKKLLTGSDDCFLATFVSRNGTRKNPLGAMEAFVKADIPNSYLYMHCPLLEEMGYDLPKAVKKFKEDKRIILSDVKPGKGLSRAALNHIYNAGDIHILISSREGFGMTYLESAAAGVPSIYTNANCVKEFGEQIGFGVDPVAHTWDIWTHSINQIVSSDDAAKVLRFCHDNPAALEEKSKSCLQFAAEHSWEKFCEEWEDVMMNSVSVSKNKEYITPHEKRRKQFAPIKPRQENSVALVTTWNERCGIARYSSNLVKNLSIQPNILVPDTSNFTEGHHVIRCWRRQNDNLQGMYSVINSLRNKTLHFQMDWAFIMKNLSFYIPFLDQMNRCGINIIFTFHTIPTSVSDPYGKFYCEKIDEILRYSKGIFHCDHHMNVVLEYNPDLKDRCFRINHGVELYSGSVPKNQEFTFVSSGFAHRSKGFQHIIKASQKLSFPHRLIIQTSAHPLDPQQGMYIDELKNMCANDKHIEIIDDYLTDAQVSDLYASSHLGVFMYETIPSQGCSGSASTCVGAGTPIISSNSPAFNSFVDFPKTDISVNKIATMMETYYNSYVEKNNLWNDLLSLTDDYRRVNSWENVAKMHEQLYYG